MTSSPSSSSILSWVYTPCSSSPPSSISLYAALSLPRLTPEGTSSKFLTLPAIEYVLTLRECQANRIHLCLIAICHKNRRRYCRALCLDQIQKEFYCRLHAIG